MRENFVQPLAISFQANQECKEENQRDKSNMKQFRMAMRNSKGQQLQEKFRALPGVYYIHTIYHFKAREFRSLTLQTVCKSELK